MTPATASNNLARSLGDLADLERRVLVLQRSGYLASTPKIDAAIQLIRSHLSLAKLDLESKPTEG